MSEQREIEESALQKAMRNADARDAVDALEQQALKFGGIPIVGMEFMEDGQYFKADSADASHSYGKIEETGEALALRERGKVPYHLVPPEFTVLLALVLEHGAVKYAARNFEKGLPPEDLLRGAEAHLMAIKAGELDDPDSKLPHAAHAAWNLLTFAMQIMRQPVIGHAYVQAMRKTRAGNAETIIQQLGEQYGLLNFDKPELAAEPWQTSVASVRNKGKSE